jgi:hypothetical protein
MLEDQRHGLESGSFVRFREVEGMTELNDMEPMEVRVTGTCLPVSLFSCYFVILCCCVHAAAARIC